MKKDALGEPSVATILVGLCFLIVAIAGAIVCIVNPDALSFDEYVQALALLGIGGGALGIGRGILAGAKASNPKVEIEVPGELRTPPEGEVR